MIGDEKYILFILLCLIMLLGMLPVNVLTNDVLPRMFKPG